MKAYLDILKKIMESGEDIPNRTGTDARAIFGMMFEHDMRTGFPLLTTKKMGPKTIFAELEGFIKGITDKRWYQERKCFIWDEWCNPQALTKYDFADPRAVIAQIIEANSVNPSISPKMNSEINKLKELLEDLDATLGTNQDPAVKDVARKLAQLYETDLGPIYGYQWRNFGKQYAPEKVAENIYEYDSGDGVDQLTKLINTLKTNPTDRRMLVLAWNPKEVENNTVALPACHWAFEVHSNGESFDLIWHQRSNDVGLGCGFNIASYAMLMKLIEKEIGKQARYLKGFFGNTHVYHDHFDMVKTMLAREPKPLPTLSIPDTGWKSIFEWSYTDFELVGYDPYPAIKAPVAV